MVQKEHFHSGKTLKSSLTLDPKTKLLMLITTTVVVSMSGSGAVMSAIKLALVIFPFLGLLSLKRVKASLIYLALYTLSSFASILWLPYIKGPLNTIFVIVCVVFSRMTPGFAMSWYFLISTTVSEFMAALERMHMPQKISIPLSVIFRFLPTVGEEFTSINEAMRMRGVSFGGGKAGDILEYRLIPLLICSVKIGDELSAAALTRGLGAPNARTNICQIGLCFLDVVLILFCVAAYALMFGESAGWIS